MEKKLYTYQGPVMFFDKCIERFWSASTFATSAKKAISNLKYRYKQDFNLADNAKISLPGKIVEED